ncbi:MAG: hypothetical protein ACP5NF_11815 [Thermoanaerobaculum sp.]
MVPRSVAFRAWALLLVLVGTALLLLQAHYWAHGGSYPSHFAADWRMPRAFLFENQVTLAEIDLRLASGLLSMFVAAASAQVVAAAFLLCRRLWPSLIALTCQLLAISLSINETFPGVPDIFFGWLSPLRDFVNLLAGFGISVETLVLQLVIQAMAVGIFREARTGTSARSHGISVGLSVLLGGWIIVLLLPLVVFGYTVMKDHVDAVNFFTLDIHLSVWPLVVGVVVFAVGLCFANVVQLVLFARNADFCPLIWLLAPVVCFLAFLFVIGQWRPVLFLQWRELFIFLAAAGRWWYLLGATVVVWFGGVVLLVKKVVCGKAVG